MSDSALAREACVEAQVTGLATLRADLAGIAQLRKAPGRFGNQPIPPLLLKHSEELTVAGLAAVLRVIDQNNWQERSFADWGAIAAPNLFGRFITADSLCRFKKDGAWGMSPHAVPHGSLHALSGTVSQALKMHGPNLGVGGGPQATADAFLLAAALLSEGVVPGLFVVLTGFEPELLPHELTSSCPGACCLAVALALVREKDPMAVASLQIGVGSVGKTAWPTGGRECPHDKGKQECLPREECLPHHGADYSWPQFVAALEMEIVAGHWRLPGGGWLAISSHVKRSQRAA
ncbi:MAG: hypothetical protein L0Y72_03270 [Gemmataceae bacterium]|nr:hypothetical protein [Gemmataceae bacterium]